jgi:uncharacterized cupin superfamily protein
MTLRVVNVLTCELDESLNQAGFRHTGASIAPRLGSARINASVYEAVPELPIWPYHYHYSSEEWLYVISGTPVLRDPGGRRGLRPGDLVCFPADHRGAHTVFGPGRFLIVATNESPGPWAVVYPDSDKVSVSPGLRERNELNALRLPRSSALDYWHGEGTAGSPDPPPIEREPTDTPSLPVTNVLSISVGAPATSRPRTTKLELGSTGLTATVIELEPGEASGPYHYEHGREAWVLVLTGALTVRHPEGEDVLAPHALVSFPEGPGGARRLINQSQEAARAVVLSTTGLPANVCYPDTGTWVMHNGPDDAGLTVRVTEPQN